MSAITSTATIQENTDTRNIMERQKKLHERLGMINPSLTQHAVGVPDRPEFDEAAAGKQKNLARTAMLAQGVDALTNAFGLARTQGAQNEWAPVSSGVGELGVSAYNNLMGMDQGYREQLAGWQDNVLDANKYNTDLAIRESENNMKLQRSQIENEIRDLRSKYEQGQLTERERMRAENRWERAALDAGFLFDRESGKLTPLQEGQQGAVGEDGEEDMFSPQERQLYNRFKHYSEQASDADLGMNGQPRTGTPSWHRDRLLDKLGDSFYLLEADEQDNQPKPEAGVYDPNTHPKTQENLKAANASQSRMLMTNVINAPDMQTRRQAGQAWYQMVGKELQERGVPQEQIPQMAEEMFAMMLQEQQGGQQQEQPSPLQPNMAGTGRTRVTPQGQVPVESQTQPEPEPQSGGRSRDALTRTAVTRLNRALQHLEGIDKVLQEHPGFQGGVGERNKQKQIDEVRRIMQVIQDYPPEAQEQILNSVSNREYLESIIQQAD